MSDDIFINFEKLYGTADFLKAIISVQNQLLVDKGITTLDELRSKLQAELTIRSAELQAELTIRSAEEHTECREGK